MKLIGEMQGTFKLEKTCIHRWQWELQETHEVHAQRYMHICLKLITVKPRAADMSESFFSKYNRIVNATYNYDFANEWKATFWRSRTKRSRCHMFRLRFSTTAATARRMQDLGICTGMGLLRGIHMHILMHSKQVTTSEDLVQLLIFSALNRTIMWVCERKKLTSHRPAFHEETAWRVESSSHLQDMIDLPYVLMSPIKPIETNHKFSQCKLSLYKRNWAGKAFAKFYLAEQRFRSPNLEPTGST